jgi:hypothetical protein
VLVANADVWYDGPVDLPGFVTGWDRRRPRLLVVEVEPGTAADFDGRWRFAGLSLLSAADAAALEAVPSGLYEAVWSRAEIDLVPSAVTFIDCGTPADLDRARRLAATTDR